MSALMVESAVDQIITILRGTLNAALDLVAEEVDDATINVEHVSANNYYISEGIEPLQPPSIFVIADKTMLDLRFQNSVFQRHHVLVGAVVEDIGVQKLTRKAWRFAQALHDVLHDQGTESFRLLVREVEYGAVFVPRTSAATSGTRLFRKDITLRCEVLHAEV